MPKRTPTKPATPAVITPSAASVTPEVVHLPPDAVFPTPAVTQDRDFTSIRAMERAACASFVEGLDIGSEAIRHAIAKALREQK